MKNRAASKKSKGWIATCPVRLPWSGPRVPVRPSNERDARAGEDEHEVRRPVDAVPPSLNARVETSRRLTEVRELVEDDEQPGVPCPAREVLEGGVG
jgi:hypothetical protein